jgi:hypothetical protein
MIFDILFKNFYLFVLLFLLGSYKPNFLDPFFLLVKLFLINCTITVPIWLFMKWIVLYFLKLWAILRTGPEIWSVIWSRCSIVILWISHFIILIWTRLSGRSTGTFFTITFIRFQQFFDLIFESLFKYCPGSIVTLCRLSRYLILLWNISLYLFGTIHH